MVPVLKSLSRFIWKKEEVNTKYINPVKVLLIQTENYFYSFYSFLHPRQLQHQKGLHFCSLRRTSSLTSWPQFIAYLQHVSTTIKFTLYYVPKKLWPHIGESFFLKYYFVSRRYTPTHKVIHSCFFFSSLDNIMFRRKLIMNVSPAVLHRESVTMETAGLQILTLSSYHPIYY